jgi:DNA-binding response OmpR family regulator
MLPPKVENVPERILVVDDERAIADTLVAILQRFGYAASAAYNAEQALEVLNVFQPGLIISDVVMGKISGVELAILIRSRLPDCKLLLMSGHATTEDLMLGARSQGYTFEIVAKPIRPQQLLPRIAAILRGEKQ